MEPDILSEFQNFLQIMSISDKKKHLEYWIDQTENSKKGEFLRLIKLADQDGLENYDDNNSVLIGFIYNGLAGIGDAIQVGAINLNLLNFAIDPRYKNNGIMTNSLLMTLNYMRERSYGYCAAFTRYNNTPSRKVLQKAGFIESKEGNSGSLFVKNISWNADEFKAAFKK
jgi:RimJ/RimL family protein N-acetyltransferase